MLATPRGSLSLDLDNAWSYARTHGDADWADTPSYLDLVVPRTLDLLGELGLRITFFVVGRDAADPANTDAMDRLGRSGHEIGNHSFEHLPWMDQWSSGAIHDDLSAAEKAIESATGHRTHGFRGPGYALSARLVEVLADRGYRYDASSLPTWIGPVARAVYFRGAPDLDRTARQERSELFGHVGDAARPLRPYRWQGPTGTLLEIPVTTMPVARVPVHVSYLLMLAAIRPALADRYLDLTVSMCSRRAVVPSILLHPLDVVGADDTAAAAFFPGMSLSSQDKLGFLRRWLTTLSSRWTLGPVGEQADALASHTLPVLHTDLLRR